MLGVLPLSLTLTDDSARLVGAYTRRGLVDVVRPPLDRINRQLLDIGNSLRMLSIDVIDIMKGVSDRRLKVQVMNEDLLDHLQATRWAVAYFSYNTFLELLEIVRYMNWLNWRSHLHLHDLINLMYDLENEIGGLGSMQLQQGSMIIDLLTQILDQLRQGIVVSGTILINITGADPLKDLDLLKLLGLLGLLALGLAIIVGFLFGVGAALKTFGLGSIVAATAVGILIKGLLPLIEALVKLGGWDFLKLAGGFTLIAGFVAGLGKAFQLFTTDLEKIVPQLKAFFEAISKLMTTLVAFKGTDFLKIGVGFAAIAGFVALLGLAFQQFKTDLSKLLPGLNAFFDSIGKLMATLASFKPGQIIKIVVGFAAIVGFVFLLGKALDTLTDKALKVIEPLAKFFTAITTLMQALAGFGFWDFVGIAFGLGLILGFIWLLGKVLDKLSDRALKAMAPVTALITALTGLASTLGNMSGLDIAGMIIGLGALAGFVWLISKSLGSMPGPLGTLLKLFGGLGSVLSVVTGIAGKLWDGLSAIGNGLGWLGGKLGGFLSGVGHAIGKVGNFIGDAGSWFGGAVSDAAGFVTDKIGDAAGWVGGKLGDAAGAVGDFFGGIGDSLFGSIDIDAMIKAQLPSATPPPPPTVVAAAPPETGTLGPGGALAAAPIGGPVTVDQTVNAGGINITITADRLEANSAQLLTDDIVAQLQARLGALRATQDFQAGARPAVA
ncbi:hypothetical protein [Flindersiella endophytica]